MNNKLIDLYLESKALAWEQSSINSEKARLNANIGAFKMSAEAYYYKMLVTKKPYTIKTTFIRLSDFTQWMIDNDHSPAIKNQFRIFLKTNKKLFKGAYEKEVLDVSFQEARQRIEAIKDQGLKAKALQLLLSGSRWTESSTLDNNGIVQGKGRKRRRLFNVDRVEFEGSYKTFLSKLKRETGLKPHSLRKLFATNLVDNGITEADLLKVMGWSSFATASSYLQSKKEDEIEQFIKRATA